MPQPEDVSIAELGLRDAMSAYKLAGDSVAYDEAASLFANAYYLADDSGEQFVALRAARGAAESHDQATGRTGADERTELWMAKAIGRLYGIVDTAGFNVGSQDVGNVQVTRVTYQPLRECVQTFNVAAKLLLRRDLRGTLFNDDDPTQTLGYTHKAYGLLRPLEAYGNAQFFPAAPLRHDQYFVNGLATFGFAELLYGSRASAALVAGAAIYHAPATESSAVLNAEKLPAHERWQAVKVASARAGALAVAVAAPKSVGRKLARKVV